MTTVTARGQDRVFSRIRSLKLPQALLPRLRLLFMAYTVFTTLAAIPQVAFAAQPPPIIAAGLLGVAIMAIRWISAYRSGRFTIGGDIAVALAIGVEAMILGDRSQAIGILYVALQFHGLYGSWRRLVPQVVMFVGAFIIGFGLSPFGAEGVVPVLAQIPNLVILAALMHLLSARLDRQETDYRRQHALAITGAALVAATMPDQMAEAALQGLVTMLPASDAWRAVIAVGDATSLRVLAAAGDRPWPAGKPSLGVDVLCTDDRAALLSGRQIRFRATPQTGAGLPLDVKPTAILTPLRVHSEFRGVLSLSGVDVFDMGVDETLRAIAIQLALALETDALRQDLAERRIEARSRSLVQNSSDLILIVDREGAVRFQTPSVARVLGYDADALKGRDVGSIIHPADRALFVGALAEVAGRRGSVTTVRARWIGHTGAVVSGDTILNNLLDDPHVSGIVLNTRDVSAEMTLQAELRRQAFHDPLTQLANRALFEDRVEHALARSDRQERTFAVMFLDIDDFKKVNDSLGHHAGDELLVGMAARLGRAVRASDTVARLGGDEFAVLLEDIAGIEDAVKVAEAIKAELAVPVGIQGRSIAPQASIGIALRRPHELGTQEILRDADLAMYAAKASGKGGHHVFHEGLRAPVLDRLQMEEDLIAGLASGAFYAEYQPLVRLSDGVICGAEALARWRHPVRGIVPPMEFIPIAEETGHIVAIGKHILRTALRACHEWSALRPGVGVSVNFSARQFQEAALVADVEAALLEAGVAPERLTVEITESILMQDIAASSAKLAQLRALGVHVSIDDFGTGYSSLSYLHRFPATSLKIDRSFVDLIGGELHDSALPRAIIAMAKSMGLVTVAEGIERREQLNGLRMLGCDLGQGFYFARPQAVEGIRDLLAGMPSGAPAVAAVA